ncbi:hypothetical protein [Thermococcus sp. Bubb.Bath]|uniref:hypothetical protein n=1 Tax=Thermococcus sp. Bubb.Bath TaxID=1638242 RepID=UPI00143B7D4A|nr:hypothetical protein [Thermococcus sp. Bubb.Bath]NJF24306.1 hypothetical protein [Thermococcus sp. Bubb.Bath]
MIEFVILLGVIGGWFIAVTTLIVMLLFGKMWGLLGIAVLILGIELNKLLKRRYNELVVLGSPKAKELARHIFEMNELIMLSSYAAALFMYVVIQKYIQVVIKTPMG